MPQKIDIHGLFIDPETITDLLLQKRISVFYPVFYEVEQKRRRAQTEHLLQFSRHMPYGIILADEERPDTASFIMDYQQALVDKVVNGAIKVGKSIAGHIAEHFKIEISGDRQYRILQSGRQVKRISIREIPAKVHLLSGQWVDVFKSSPGYNFQGGDPYAVTDVGAAALMISTKNKSYVLFGAGIDASNEEVLSAYKSLVVVYNEIQAQRDAAIAEQTKKPFIQMPQIKIQLPAVRSKRQEINTIKELPEHSSEASTVNGNDEE